MSAVAVLMIYMSVFRSVSKVVYSLVLLLSLVWKLIKCGEFAFYRNVNQCRHVRQFFQVGDVSFTRVIRYFPREHCTNANINVNEMILYKCSL